MAPMKLVLHKAWALTLTGLIFMQGTVDHCSYITESRKPNPVYVANVCTKNHLS